MEKKIEEETKTAKAGNKGSIGDIINQENIKIFVEGAKKYRNIVKVFFGDKAHEKAVVSVIAGITVLILTISIIQVVQQANRLNLETKNLEKLEKYDTQTIKSNSLMQNISSTANTIDDLLKANQNIQDEISRYTKHKEELQSSYSNFLQYLLVPKLNIWKEAYTDNINVNLLGKSFLENNPFNDINLYQKWSNFFGSTEKNQINTIENLEIGDITETEFGLYKIKISFNFTTPTKNALLFLADKISITSDKENISLLGEFVYYLRQQIKNDKEKEIGELMKDPNNKEIADNQDKVIGKELYRWVSSNGSSPLIDEKIINKTVKNIMECGNGNESECFYKFREKYRNIGELAYTVGSANNTEKTNDLKMFFQNMPPLMTVQSFTFDKKVSDQALDTTVKYMGNANIEIYGQNITAGEIQEIAKELNKKCFGTEGELNAGVAIAKINSNTTKEATTDGNYSKVSRASEFKSIIENIDKEYATANNYKKTIRLFEIYRMLNEGGFCTTI